MPHIATVARSYTVAMFLDVNEAKRSRNLGIQVNLRAESRAQVERWRRAAKSARRTLSDWIRLSLDAATQVSGERRP